MRLGALELSRCGRVVKLIGDEAMFVCPDPLGAVRGALLARGGDYFGRAVNLASRLVEGAPAGSVLADDLFVGAISDDSTVTTKPQGPAPLKGLGTVEVWSVGAVVGP